MKDKHKALVALGWFYSGLSVMLIGACMESYTVISIASVFLLSGIFIIMGFD